NEAPRLSPMAIASASGGMTKWYFPRFELTTVWVLRNLGIRLVGIDVDGTLVGAGGLIHPSVWDAARRAHQNGIRLTLCSGRPAFGLALEYARQLDASGWHVFQNGASVLDLGKGTSRSVAIPSAWIARLIGQARITGEALELYGDT